MPNEQEIAYAKKLRELNRKETKKYRVLEQRALINSNKKIEIRSFDELIEKTKDLIYKFGNIEGTAYLNTEKNAANEINGKVKYNILNLKYIEEYNALDDEDELPEIIKSHWEYSLGDKYSVNLIGDKIKLERALSKEKGIPTQLSLF